MRALHRRLLQLVLAVVSHPRLTLAIAGALLVACIGLALARLTISTDQNKLFDPNVPFFRDWLRFTKNFPENDAMYVVVRPRNLAHPPALGKWTAIADAITDKLRSMPRYVQTVDDRVPLDKLGPQGLLFDDPKGVHENFKDIQRFSPLVKLWAEKPSGLTALLGPTGFDQFLGAMQLAPADAETRTFTETLARSWNETLAHDGPIVKGHGLPDLARIGADDPSQLGYYYVKDEVQDPRYPLQHLLLVRVYERPNYTSMTAISETVEAINTAVQQVARSFPEFQVGLTGRSALDADEMRTTDRDSHISEIIALSAVFVGLVVMLRSFWLALAGELALGVGIGWTFGWATLSLGELNLLSIVFLLALIGIGMDYLVQILTRYRHEAARRSRPSTIWVGVFYHVSAPINTACLGAAGAFLVSALTRFRGAADLGIIAGGGLLLCLLAGYVVLPALLTLFPGHKPADFPPPRPAPRKAKGWRHALTPALWALLVAIGLPFAFTTKFNPNLLALQAPNHESVRLVRHLQTWSATEVSDPRQPREQQLAMLRKVRSALDGSPTVKSTESILTAYDNLAWLQAHESELPAIHWSAPAPVDPSALKRIAAKAAALSRRFDFPATTSSSTASTTRSTTSPAPNALSRFASTLDHAQGADADRIAARLTAWQLAFIPELQQILAQFHPKTLDLAALPPELKDHYVGKDGAFALHINPVHNLWEQSKLIDFVRDVESRIASVPDAPPPTGIAVNIYHSTAEIEQSFYAATLYALVLIFILVLIDMRRLGQTLLAISVLALGLPMLVILMGLLQQDWNFANFFALPILIGAGHEYGVFLVHRYREARHDTRRTWQRWDVSDRALLLCAYVTCTSFGFFWAIANHRGLRSLGLVMALGTACIYLSAVLVLRPLLIWRLEVEKRRTEPQIHADQQR